MGDTRPVFTLQQDKLSGYTLVGNVRYPTRGDKLAAVPAGKMPVVPDEKGQANILGGEAALWAENVRAPLLDLAVAACLRGGGAAVVGAGRHRRKQHVPATGGDRRPVGGVGRPAAARGNGARIHPAEQQRADPAAADPAEAVEPAQYYTRQHLKFRAGNYHQFEPLNRFADALPPESGAVRDMHARRGLVAG